MLTRDAKAAVIEGYRRHETDTGSVEVQVSALTARINQLTGHLRQHEHDFASRRGLLQLVGRRRRLLAYLNHSDVERYRTLISRLGLRK